MNSTLRDIKPLIPMHDYSLLFLIIALILGGILGYYLFKKVYIKTIEGCRVNCEKYYFYQFSNIDWSNPKEAAYLATRYGLVLAKDRRRKELFSQLRESLEKYKYRRNIDTVDETTLNYYNLYKQVCDESL